MEPLLWKKGWETFSPHIDGWCGDCLAVEIDMAFNRLERGEIAQPQAWALRDGTFQTDLCYGAYVDWSDT